MRFSPALVRVNCRCLTCFCINRGFCCRADRCFAGQTCYGLTFFRFEIPPLQLRFRQWSSMDGDNIVTRVPVLCCSIPFADRSLSLYGTPRRSISASRRLLAHVQHRRVFRQVADAESLCRTARVLLERCHNLFDASAGAGCRRAGPVAVLLAGMQRLGVMWMH